jgi:hypothetical protein
MAGLTWCERKTRVRGVKLAGQANLNLPIKDKALDLAGTVIWASDGFLSSTEPTVVKTPAGCGGVYSIHAVVHWGVGGWKTFFPEYRDANYFVTQLRKKNSVAGQVREARATDEPTIPATITRQEVMWETKLSVDDSIEVLVTCEVWKQEIIDKFHESYGVGWGYQLEYWLTIRRLGRLI